jgi:hypothetical protein
MTKAQELELLRSLIKSLGPDTYLGPWLSEVAAEVEQMIKNDIFPDVSLKDCARRVKYNQEACDRDCDSMRQKAIAEAKDINDRAMKQREAIRTATRMALQRAINEI